MRAKTMNIVFMLVMYICFTISMNAQKSITILLNNQRTSAQVLDGKLISIDKNITEELLNAIRNPVKRDAQYYKELNEILAGEYGSYYAGIVKYEIEAIQKGVIKTSPEELSYTTVVDLPETIVRFISGTARLNGASSDKLIKFTEKVRTLNINYILIEGHKKSNSINDYILTTNRVNACKDYLLYKGVNKSKIKTKILLSTSDKDISKSVKIIVR